MTRPLTLELPEDIAEAATQAANANGETLEAYFARLVSYDAERETTERFFAERRARADVAAARELLTRPRGEAPEPSDMLPEGFSPRG